VQHVQIPVCVWVAQVVPHVCSRPGEAAEAGMVPMECHLGLIG